MITVFCDLHKSISQFYYNNLISGLDFHSLECPKCHHKACLTKHAYYYRQVRNYDTPVKLKVLRAFCHCCKTTHAIVPDSIVPYSQVPFENHVDIALCNNDEDLLKAEEMNPNIAIETIRYIHRCFTLYWKARLITFKLKVSYDVIPACFKYFSRQFMQNRACPNILFQPPT